MVSSNSGVLEDIFAFQPFTIGKFPFGSISVTGRLTYQVFVESSVYQTQANVLVGDGNSRDLGELKFTGVQLNP